MPLSIIQKPEARPRRVCIYGVHGVGKSTLAASCPAPVFVQTEDGLGDIDAPRYPLAGEFNAVMGAFAELYKEEHDRQTVIVDSLDWLERLIWADVCAEKKVASIEDIPYAKGYSFALSRWKRVLDACNALRDSKAMTVIFLAHSKVEKVEPPAGESYDRYAPKLNKHAVGLISEWVDELLLATYKIYTKSNDEGFGRSRTVAIGDGERVLYTSERPSHLAKNRLKLPDKISFDSFLPSFFGD